MAGPLRCPDRLETAPRKDRVELLRMMMMMIMWVTMPHTSNGFHEGTVRTQGSSRLGWSYPGSRDVDRFYGLVSYG
jgi:hypothetical protein